MEKIIVLALGVILLVGGSWLHVIDGNTGYTMGIVGAVLVVASALVILGGKKPEEGKRPE